MKDMRERERRETFHSHIVNMGRIGWNAITPSHAIILPGGFDGKEEWGVVLHHGCGGKLAIVYASGKVMIADKDGYSISMNLEAIADNLLTKHYDRSIIGSFFEMTWVDRLEEEFDRKKINCG